MLEDFPEDIKHLCKLKALSQRQTLKLFVENALRAAVGMPVPGSSHEVGQGAIRRSSPPNAPKASVERIGNTRREKA